MANRLLSLIFILSLKFAAALANDSELVEQLFLDIPLNDVIHNTSMLPLVEPWASKYVDSIRNQRFGDAVWARYQIEGGVKNGIIEESNLTVLESIREDAVEYKANAPVQYAEALLFYANTSKADRHPEVIKAITNITSKDIAHFQSLQERATFGTRCSNDNLALQSDCFNLLADMFKGKVLIGDTRGVSTYGGCRFRVGPYRSSTDLTFRSAFAVGVLIEERCSKALGCCRFTSGWSPANSGHRKLCLSSKRSGCS